MDRELNPRPSVTTVSCNNSDCTFFGSQATEGFCSVCYQKELQRRKQSISEAADVIVPKPEELSKKRNIEESDNSVFESEVQKINNNNNDDDEQVANPLTSINSSSSKPKKPKKAKCGVCKKKLGLTGFECRCGKQFCAIHRYTDKHDCSFDWETLGKDQLRKANPVVQNAKIQKF